MLVHMGTRDTGIVLTSSPAQGHKRHSTALSFGGPPTAGAARDAARFQVLGELLLSTAAALASLLQTDSCPPSALGGTFLLNSHFFLCQNRQRWKLVVLGEKVGQVIPF